MNTYDKQHLKSIDYYLNEISNLYDAMITDIAAMATGVYVSGEFSFDRLPSLRRRAEKRINEGGKRIIITIQNGNENAWNLSNQKNDKLVESLFKTSPKAYTLRNEEALRTFQSVKTKGLTLSDRVWNLQGNFKTQIEQSIQAAIKEGKSAQTLSREIKQFLNNPDALKRTLRAQGVKTGQGVYMSAHKNAMRLAGNEINKAYRLADWTRWQQLDFVIGYDIIPSRSIGVCPLCTQLAGRYPKNFLFTGWHVSCRCACVPVLCTDAEMNKLNTSLSVGKSVSFRQPSMPQCYQTYQSGL